MNNQSAISVHRLLQETITKYVSPSARVVGTKELPIGSGLSGAKVRRYQVALAGAHNGRTAVTLVTKEAALLERRTSALLSAQGHACIPFTHMLDRTSDTTALMCQQDVGDMFDPDTPEVLRLAADSLAAIHQMNLGQEEALAWLPRADRTYFQAHVVDTTWRPAWNSALAHAGFVREFGPYINQVEAAATMFPDAMEALCSDETSLTLVHMDLSVGNVLFQHNTIFFIDWQEPKYGSFYLDLPTHFWTLERAEVYRQALTARGLDISRTDFAEGYRAAARYVAFRYLWWNLEVWIKEPTDGGTEWMIKYFKMAIGEN